MQQLPVWVFPSALPSVYDSESFTALEMVYKLYGAVNELIGEYNKTVENLNGFQEEEKAAREEFELKVTKVIRQFMCDMETYLKTNLAETAREVVNNAIKSGELSLLESYDEASEALTIQITGGV